MIPRLLQGAHTPQAWRGRQADAPRQFNIGNAAVFLAIGSPKVFEIDSGWVGAGFAVIGNCRRSH